jgi:cell division protein FtsB
MAKPAPARRRRRPPRSTLVARWLAAGALVLAAALYFRPLHTYMKTRSELTQRRAEVRALAAKRRALARRLATSTSTGALAVEARRLGFVKPGEHLFIVKGIPAWRRAHAATVRARGG